MFDSQLSVKPSQYLSNLISKTFYLVRYAFSSLFNSCLNISGKQIVEKFKLKVLSAGSMSVSGHSAAHLPEGGIGVYSVETENPK